MKLEKTYIYPAKYLYKFVEVENSMINDKLKFVLKNNNGSYSIQIYNKELLVKTFEDNGETLLFLKGLGKIYTIAKIASKIKIGSNFEIEDKYSNIWGISKINTLNNDYIVFGGYDNWSILLDIQSQTEENIIDTMVSTILEYSDKYGFADIKSMYIRISQDVAINMNSEFFIKPYIYIV